MHTGLVKETPRISTHLSPCFDFAQFSCEKQRSARRPLIGRQIRMTASGKSRAISEFIRTNHCTKKLWDIRAIFKMASVAPKVGRQLSFTRKVWNAFHDWYINACGYRQLGKFLCQRIDPFYAKSPYLIAFLGLKTRLFSFAFL